MTGAKELRQPVSAVEKRISALTPTPSEVMLQQLLAVLGSGRRSATYKPALVLALLELAVERAPIDDDTLVLPLPDVAERVLELYWPAARPYPGVNGPLRQATAPNSRIGAAISDLRNATHAGHWSLGRLRITNPQHVAQAVSRIAAALAMQPVPRLQRPGEAAGQPDYPRFLYDDSRYQTERGCLDPNPVIALQPGVATAMTRNAALIRLAAQAAWVDEVLAINRLHPQERSVHEFIFGADRTSLARVSHGLADLQGGRCFYCQHRLTSIEVDHVIPWTLNPNDDLFNLVATDRRCNNNKRDRLPIGEPVHEWAHRDRTQLRQLADDRQWPYNPARTAATARSAYLSAAAGIPAWRGPGHIIPIGDTDRTAALAAVSQLLHDLAATA